MSYRRQRIAEDDVVDRLVLDEHVRTANGVSFGVVILAIEREVGLRIMLTNIFLGD